MGDFPVWQFIVIFIGLFGICFGIILLLASSLSEDKERGIIRQLWEAYFGNSNHQSKDNDNNR